MRTYKSRLPNLGLNIPKAIIILVFGLLAGCLFGKAFEKEVRAAGNTYYVRADGAVTCGNKSNATSPNSAATSLSMAQVNLCGFSSGDQILFSSQGGDYTTAFVVPSGGLGVEEEITYAKVAGETPQLIIPSGNFINTNGKSNIIIDGLKAFCDYHYSCATQVVNGILVDSGTNIILKNEYVSVQTNSGYNSTGITIGGTASGVTVEDTFSRGRGGAVLVTGDASEISLNRVEATSVNASAFSSKGTSHNQIYTNCVARDSGVTGFDASESAYNITYNGSTAYNNSSNGFASLNLTHDITYNRDIAYSNGIWTSSANGTGFIPHNSSTNIYHYNCIAYNNKNSGFGDVGTGNVFFYNMVSWGNGYMVGDTFRGSAVTASSVRGNLYFAKTGGMAKISNSIMGQSKPREIRDSGLNYTTYDYNIYYPIDNNKFYSPDNVVDTSWEVYSSQEPNSINEDPKFTSPVSDFRLQSTSPAIDAGIDLGESTDFAGKKSYDMPGVVNTGSTGEYTRDYVDIGAYEYVIPPNPVLSSSSCPDESSWCADDTPEVAVSQTSPTTGYRYLVSQIPDPDKSSVEAGSSDTDGTFTVPLDAISTDGTWYVHIVAQNLDGDFSDNYDTYILKIDTTAPEDFTPTSNPATWTSANFITLTFAAVDALSGIGNYQVKIDEGSYGTEVLSPYYLDVSNIDDGTHRVTIKASDSVGNAKEESVFIYTDKILLNISNGEPSGLLPSDITNTNLSILTNEAATCKYSPVPGVVYEDMMNIFSNTGGTEHSTAIIGLASGHVYRYYIRCRDYYGDESSEDFVITFSVADTQNVNSPSDTEIDLSNPETLTENMAGESETHADDLIANNGEENKKNESIEPRKNINIVVLGAVGSLLFIVLGWKYIKR